MAGTTLKGLPPHLLHLPFALPVLFALYPNPNFLSPFLDPITGAAARLMDFINSYTLNYGWTMLVMAFIVQVLMLPFTIKQYQSMQEMQALAPYIKRLQTKYKDNKQKLNEEQMKLYQEHGVNPLGGCVPLLLQYPFLIAMFYAIGSHTEQFKQTTWLWLNPAACSVHLPFIDSWHIFACNLAGNDKLLVAVYALSLYFSMLLSPTATMDPQQQQMMKIQSMLLPVMFFFISIKVGWPSAFLIYWTGFSLFGILERAIIMRMPHRIKPLKEKTKAEAAGFPRTCPACNAELTVVKGNRCSACGVKVKRLPPSVAPPSGDGRVVGGAAATTREG